MEDDDDNESIISVNRMSDTNVVGNRVAILKSSRSDSGSSSRRDRRRNRSRDRDGNNRRVVVLSNTNSGSSRNRGKGGSSSTLLAPQWSNNDMRYSSSELLDITSLSEAYNGDVLNTNKITNLLANLPEDMRISKLLRQLSTEKDAVEARKICMKLNIVIMDGTNANYIRRSFDILADHILRTFKDGPIDAMNDVAAVFGKMGWIVRSDFSIYRQWIQKMHKNERIREYALKALQETLEMDSMAHDIRMDNCNRIIEMLKEYLDGSDQAAHFVAVTNVIQQFAQNYPKAFQPHFADIVDFVIGWHLETDQVLSIKQHCAYILQQFKPFWLNDVAFTRNLLNQFLEDIISYRDEIQSHIESTVGGSSSSTPTPEICFGSIVGATNSILKCIYDTPTVLCNHIGIDLLSDIFRSVLEMIQAFECTPQKHYTLDQRDVIYMYVNELIVIALDCRKIGIEGTEEMLLETVELQLRNLSPASASDQKIVIILFVIYKLVAELKSEVPITFIQTIFSTEPTCVIHQMKFSRNNQIVKSIVKIYQAVLNLKVVEILQELYGQIIDDLMVAVDILQPRDAERMECAVYTKEQAECILNFYLRTISTLATASSSIIVMWVLEPNILELLSERLQSAEFEVFWSHYPETHFAIISLLTSHCRNNNNFIASSTLLNEELTKITDVFSKLNMDDNASNSSFSEFVPGASSFNMPVQKTANTESSPTAGHFELILKYLCKILKQRSLPEHTVAILLDWCENIFKQTTNYAIILKNNVEFLQIFESIGRYSSEFQAMKKIQMKAAECFDALLTYDVLHSDVLESIAEICCVKMCVSDAIIRKKYADLFAKLPLNVSLKQVNQFTGLAKAQHRQINNIQHWYLRTQQRGVEMRARFVVDFTRAIKIRETDINQAEPNQYEIIEKILKNIFIHSQNSCVGIHSKSKLNEIAEFCKVAMADVRVLISWAQWETAQSCVNNKLRTFLGKPQETFLKIESIIKENARILSLKDKLKVPNVDTILANQRHARILLGFMEALEKYIYNASEGTVCLPPAEKPARTFFHVNATTCNEWFNRIRTAVDLVALHCMEPEMVIRYTESVLKNLASNGKINEPLFEHTLMSHTWALLRNKEGDALEGLFVWTKSITKKKLMWIKMAAEQANGHLETATAGYKNILANLDEPKHDAHFREFIFDQLTLCLLNSQEWHELYEVLRTEEGRNTPRATIPLLSINSNQIENFIEYQKSNDAAILEMSDWEVLNNDSNGIANDFSYHRLISLTENTISNMSIESQNKHIYNTELERSCFEIVQSGLQECLRTKSREHLNNLVVMNHICHKVANRNRTGERENTHSLCVDKSFGSTVLTKLLNWSEYFDNVTEIGEQINLDLRLDVCSMTRKEGNLTHCRKQLEIFFEKINFGPQIGCVESKLDVICERLINSVDEPQWDMNIWNQNTVRSVYEMAKWLYSYPDKKETAIQFAAANSITIRNSLECIKGTEEEPLIQQRIARSFLNLAEWLQSENDQFLMESANKPIGKLINSMDDHIFLRLRNANLNYEGEEVSSILSPIDVAVGKLLSQSIQQCPNLSKSYGAYAGWCYRWGRKIVELRTEKNEKAGLRPSDLCSIKDLIPNASSGDIDLISNVLDSHKVSAEDEELVVSNSDDISSTELIESQLRQIGILSDCSTETLQKIIEIWRLANRNIYSFYEMAAEAYFKYLQLATQMQDDGLVNVTNIADDGKSNENCSVVTATLRILRLIVKHALGLQEVLEHGLETTPTSPWKIIIPQLFSRLNHHEPYVRKRVSELLCRVARDSPHLIIFPAVVGAAQEQRVNFTDLSTFSANGDRTQTPNSALTTCFNSLLDTLSKQASEQVQQVQLMVRELKRITLLWEELWLSSLSQVYSECAKRMAILENDLTKLTTEETNSKQVDDNKRTVLAEKYRVIIRPILFVMERLNEATSVKAETANELAFQERFSPAIQETITSLKEPLQFTSSSPDGWSKFKQLYTVLQQRSQKRSTCQFKMADISPVLAQMKNTVISMPGIENHQNRSRSDGDNRWIYIRSVDNFVQILPTKTKPKKLAFYGSDGRKHTYLFKGLEDLHLDERIMQFLSIANSMMSKTRTTIGQTTKYRAKHYSVTPLGAHSGLISWVDGMTPIFALYKKWQQRQATSPKKEKSPSTTANAMTTSKNTPPQAIPRPSELYFQKLTPLLNKHNIKATQSSRKEWPLQVLKEVLAELTAETPRDLLSKELWCYSTNAAEWRQVIRNYAQSLAVMSVIGYVIGLGDRHLDNILVDLMTGEILHIDYNVCFEKGKTLRVPEKVPFRMTPNLQEALGVTGIEGTFRLACEHVLKTLKKGRETLLTLLEAFVYDPLVDWAVAEDTIGGAGGGDGTNDTPSTRNRQITERDRHNTNIATFGATEMAFGIETARKQMQDEFNRDTLIIQFTELKPDWIQNRDGFFNQLKQVQAYLLSLQQQRLRLQSLEENRLLLAKQAAMVSEAGALDSALGSHPLSTLAHRYSGYKQKKDECDKCRRALLDRMSMCNKQMMDYHNCLYLIETNKVAEKLGDLNKLTAALKVIHPNHAFDLVKDFLDNSAQNVIYLQSCQLSSGLDVLVKKQIATIQQTLETLVEYGAITRYHPPKVHQTHRITKYGEWCKYLAEHQSVQDCHNIAKQFQMTIGKNIINKEAITQVIDFSSTLQTTLRDGEFKLQKLLERLNVERDNAVMDGNSSANIMQYTNLFEDARNSIRMFFQDQNTLSPVTSGSRVIAAAAAEKKYNVLALHCVTITILCDLNKRLLMMENAAANSAGMNNMVALTFNGNWVLDELYAHSAIMCEMSSIIEKAHRDHGTKTLTEPFFCATKCLCEIQNIHEILREFNEQISLNILNDALYCIISEKESIFSIISAFDILQRNIESISDLTTNLYVALRHGSNAEVTTRQASADVAILRQNFNAIKMQIEQNAPNEFGSKLFLRINGLFDKLDDEYDRLIDCLQDLNLVGDQLKIDQMKNATQLASCVLNGESRAILKEIFFVKKIEAIAHFFANILAISVAFRASGEKPLREDSYKDSVLCLPLRNYLTDFVWRKMFGLQSYCVTVILCDLLHGIGVDVDSEINMVDVGAQNIVSMEELCNKSIEKYVRNEKIPKMIVTQATTLCWNLDGAFRKLCTIQNIQNHINCQQNTLIRTQLILTAHFWMFEELLTKQTGFSIVPTRNRATIMLQLDETTKTLIALQSTVQRQKDELGVLTTAINQRLKWAAGANPQLVNLMNDFASTVTNRHENIERVGLLATAALNESSAILQYEKLRVSTTEALDEDQKFLNLISQWEKCCTIAQTCVNVVTPVEVALIELLDPEGPIDRMWLNNVAGLIDEMINQVQQDISKIEREIVDSQDELQSCAYRLRALMATHNRVGTKILTLVNAIYRIVDEDKKLILSEYVERHGLMKETITELQGHSLSKDFTEELVNVTLNQTAELLNTLKDIFNNLINVGNLLNENDKTITSPVIAQVQQQDCMLSRPSSPSKSKAQKGMEQKRNAYAVSVWRRIRMKLEGRDPDPTRRYSTAEQVDWMIREAMDANNLAVLYEGWTPWV
ncbi:serine/threonine-protein kinase Smg1 [Contarinia nasturtii]|uniref:serine/threonine-protein kinase Smg1 n=1 Tax=Contarinia nasturtii TaxID=265458 RepID=UPI0012D3CAC2|nr:serine/threonine-protein kinase Smg1 [Contarinia nasturtii]